MSVCLQWCIVLVLLDLGCAFICMYLLLVFVWFDNEVKLIKDTSKSPKKSDLVNYKCKISQGKQALVKSLNMLQHIGSKLLSGCYMLQAWFLGHIYCKSKHTLWSGPHLCVIALLRAKTWGEMQIRFERFKKLFTAWCTRRLSAIWHNYRLSEM